MQLHTGRTTYHIGLMQARAYRILKSRSAKALLPYNISTLDWALIGLLYEQESGRKFVEIANALGVEAPLITRLADELVAKKWVASVRSEIDARAKKLVLTSKGRTQVPIIEAMLKTEMNPLLANLSLEDRSGYFKTLETIAYNDARMKGGEHI